MNKDFGQARDAFLQSAGKTFDKYVEENNQPPIGTGIVNVGENGDSNSAWLTHQPKLQDISPVLAKSAALDFTRDVQNEDIDMYDSNGKETTSQSSRSSTQVS